MGRKKSAATGLPSRRRVLLFINEFKIHHDYSPSVQEIGTGTGIASTSNVSLYMKDLKGEKMIDYEPRNSRTVRLTPLGKQHINEMLKTKSEPASTEKELGVETLFSRDLEVKSK